MSARPEQEFLGYWGAHSTYGSFSYLMYGMMRLFSQLEAISQNPNVDIQGILPTMFDRRLLHSREAVEILKENFGDLVYNTKIRKTIRYAEAPVKGQSVLTYDPTGEAATLYRDLAKEVLNGAKAREHA